MLAPRTPHAAPERATVKRLPPWGWLLAALVTFLIALATGELQRAPVYGAGISALSKEPSSVSVLFYGNRFDSYLAEGRLVMPRTGWKITRTEDFVRLDNLPNASPLEFSPGEQPMKVSLLRHPWGGVAGVDGMGSGFRRIDLNAPRESVEHFEIGGSQSAVAARGSRLRFTNSYGMAMMLATFLLLAGVAWQQWPRQEDAEPARQAWGDLARSLAIFGVVLIHVCAPKFYQYGRIPLEDWLQLTLLDSLVRCSVPLFVMLSGALLLKPGAPQLGVREVGRRVRKLLVPLLVWSVVFLLYNSRLGKEPIDWAAPLETPAMYHLWFVYMIIGIYLMLPILQGVINAIVLRRDLQWYLLALWLVLTSAPLYAPMPLLQMLQQTSLLGYGGYFLLGAILASRPAPGPSWAWALLYAAAVAATFALTWHASQAAGKAVERAFQYFSLNVVVASVAAFVLLARTRPTGRLATLFQWVSDRSFLVFFVHVLLLERAASSVDALQLQLPAAVELLVVTFATFLLCLAAAAALRVIPKSREVTG